MTISIRTFLLINLLLSITLITSLAVIGNLFLEHRDLQNHLDTRLALAALTMQSLLGEDIANRNLAVTQGKIDAIPELAKQFYAKAHGATKLSLSEKIQFQVLDYNDHVLLSSYPDKLQPIIKRTGFHDKWVKEEPWRVFTARDQKTGIRIEVAERYNFRQELEGRISRDSIFIMLIAYPFLGFLIWIIIGRGLDSIRKVAVEVKQRELANLKEVDLKFVPTEVKPLVDELNRLFKRLEEAFEREKRFAADAAHELRTPLAALRAQAQVALKAIDDQERKTALNKVLVSVDRSVHVVQQLLALSRTMPGAALEQPIAVDLTKQATQVITDLVPEAIKRNTDIELVIPNTNKPPIIAGYPTAINILIRNLIDNAIRYTPENSLVKVGTKINDNQVTLYVTDNGPGIPEELHQRVFERFFRVLGTKSSGSGLGLGIVQQIADLHQATISLETPGSGHGLTISISFPAYDG